MEMNKKHGEKLDLTKYISTKKDFAEGYFPKFLLEINGETYIFKMNKTEQEKDGDFTYYQDIVEVFCSKFFKAVGIKNFVEYQLAKCGDDEGCVCKSFNEQGVQSLNLRSLLALNFYNEKDKKVYPISQQFDVDTFYKEWDNQNNLDNAKESVWGVQYSHSVDSLIAGLNKFSQTYNLNLDKNEIKKQLKEMVILDFFMYNGDRNPGNITFLVDKNNMLKMAPLYDHGFNFGLDFIKRKVDPKELGFGFHVGLSDVGRYHGFWESKWLKMGGLVALDIYELSQKDDHIKTLVQNIRNCDFEKIFNEMETENGILIDKDIKSTIQNFFDSRVQKYDNTIRKLNKKINQNIEK